MEYSIKRVAGVHTWIYLYRDNICVAFLSDGSGDESYETPSIMADDNDALEKIKAVYYGKLSLEER